MPGGGAEETGAGPGAGPVAGTLSDGRAESPAASRAPGEKGCGWGRGQNLPGRETEAGSEEGRKRQIAPSAHMLSSQNGLRTMGREVISVRQMGKLETEAELWHGEK